MVLTVNLNPNFDRYVKLSAFTYGGMNRIQETREDATSKGINVARVLHTLGIESVCTGFMYRENGKVISDMLDEENIGHDYVWLPGAVRTNLKLLDLKTGIITEVNDKGVPAREESLQALKEKVLSYANRDSIIVFIGSMPPGCPAGYFAELIGLAKEHGALCALDAEGEVLKAGIASEPYLVKINRHELETLVGAKMETVEQIVEESLKITGGGVKLLAVSLGAEGSILTDGHKVLRAQPLSVTAVSPTGAGDTMLAALVRGIIQNNTLEEMLCGAAAASTATALREGTHLMTMEMHNSLWNQVQIEQI